MQSRVPFALLALASISLTSCFVGMAVSGKPAPGLSVVKQEAARSGIELRLGSPVQTSTNSDGELVAMYRREVGNVPSASRAVGHGTMNSLTLGL